MNVCVKVYRYPTLSSWLVALGSLPTRWSKSSERGGVVEVYTCECILQVQISNELNVYCTRMILYFELVNKKRKFISLELYYYTID